MAESSVTNPQIVEPNSSLEQLAITALRVYGDFSPGSTPGETMLLFLTLANFVIDEIRSHPYWDGSKLDYYTHIQDTRPIPDHLMLSGLLAKYAAQQRSDKVQIYQPMYISTLNNLLWYRKNGNTPISMTVVDGGSHPSYAPGVTNRDNGQVE